MKQEAVDVRMSRLLTRDLTRDVLIMTKTRISLSTLFLSGLMSGAANAQPAQQPDPLMGMLPLIIIFILFYFMLIRPQMKRAKEQRKMLDALQKGDEVVTGSGLVGKVAKVGEQYVSLEIAEGVITQVQKQSVQTLLPKGTIKNI